MESEKLLTVSIIIFAIFAGILAIVNTIAFASATDGTCSSINKAYAETMMVLNIVLIFLSVAVVAFMFYELFKKSGKKDLLEEQAPKQAKQPVKQPVKQDEAPRYVQRQTMSKQLPQSKIEDASSIFDRPVAIREELAVAKAWNV
jgi:hypothetical protein